MLRTKKGEKIIDIKLIAELLNDQFHSIFNKEPCDIMPYFPLKTSSYLDIENVLPELDDDIIERRCFTSRRIML